MSEQAEKRFVDAWRFAAPRLEAIRRRELQQLEETAALPVSDSEHASTRAGSGLMHFQAWMMRWRVIQLHEQLNER